MANEKVKAIHHLASFIHDRFQNCETVVNCVSFQNDKKKVRDILLSK
jgi:hypothetical protein